MGMVTGQYDKAHAVKNVLGILVLLLLSAVARAQQWPFEMWHEGRIVLTQGDTLKGMIKYDLQQDLVQYSWAQDKVEAFTARKVLFFEIFDNTVHKYRQFYALPYAATGNYKTPVFFELLEEGKLTLLAREALEYRTYNSMYYLGTYSRLVLINKYYFLEENGDINEFRGNRSDLLDRMGKHSRDVEKYMKANRLKQDDKYDFARIVSYYNSFFKTS
jgi:hypothetical protein